MNAVEIFRKILKSAICNHELAIIVYRPQKDTKEKYFLIAAHQTHTDTHPWYTGELRRQQG